MPRRLDKTLADYLVIAISPALIMVMIASLVFFLLEVFYQGNYAERLHFIMALFVMGTVLIGRISIEDGAERAGLFSLPLAIVAILAMNRFVRIEGVPMAWLFNWALLALIWWCAHKLTWDCTLIDESERDPGGGLLENVKWTKTPALADDLEHRERPHPPGLWVIYFSLAALPLFGIGQWFIPAANLASRQYAFRLLCVYVGSGLALLLTTSFLGLRRYLRHRRQEMPAAMAGLWVTTGSILIVGLLLFAALLPRPGAEYEISRLPLTLGSPDQHPSEHGLGKDGPSTNENTGRKRIEERGEAPSDAAGDEPVESESGNRQQNASNDGEPTTTDTAVDADEGTAESERSNETSYNDNQENPAGPAEPQRDGGDSQPGPSQPTVSHELPMPAAGWLMTLVKWVFYAALIYGFWRYRDELLAMAADLLRQLAEFWRDLWGGKSKPTETEETEQRSAAVSPPKPFADFKDPFASGMATRCSADELVRYTFEAFEAWSREHDCGREPEQTPHEFVRNVGIRYAALSRHAQRLADLYCRVAYARGSLPPDSSGHLRLFWEELRSERIAAS